MHLSCSAGVSLKKKNPRSQSFFLLPLSKITFSHFMEDVVRVPMTPQPSAGEGHQQVSRAPCSNFSVVGEIPLRTSLTVQIFSESY